MPPSNSSFATAIEIPSFPYDTTQNVADGGVNYTVYYKFTAPADGLVFFFGVAATLDGGYTVRTNGYLGPAGSPTGLVFGEDSRPIQMQVTSGLEYFLEFEKRNDIPIAVLALSTEFLAQQAVLPGYFIINDDTDGFPAVIVSPDTNDTALASFANIVAGEAGDALDNNVMAFSDEWNDGLVTYDEDFNVIATIDTSTLGTPFIRNMNGEKFYVAFDGTGAVRVRDLLDTGAFGAVDFLLDGNTHIRGVSANNDETILYFGNATLGTAVKRWDIVNDVALSNFVAGVGNEYIVDILVLADDTIVVLSNRLAGDNFTNYIRRYNAGGTLLTTFEYISQNPANTFPRLSHNHDRTNFWLMAHEEDTGAVANYGSGITKFIQYDLTTGLQTTLIRQAQYEAGAYIGGISEDPPLFGVSFSCPFIVRRGDVTPPTDPNPLISQVAVEVLTLPPTLNGIYYIDTSRTVNRDIYYQDELKIPNPVVRTAFIGE